MRKALKFVCVLLLFGCNRTANNPYAKWEFYAGTQDGSRYSSLQQITTENVSQLKVAWRFSTNDKDTGNRSQIQCNPIIVNGNLYGVSPRLQLFSVNAASGKLNWMFDPSLIDSAAKKDLYAYYKVSRGVMYWESENGEDKRILYGAADKLIAVNAVNGEVIKGFGKNGFVQLTDGLDRDFTDTPFVVSTTPGIIYKNLVIMGSRVNESADAAPGHIRAYDILTGEKKWIFHTIPHPGETGYETWPDKNAWKKLGGANSWAGFSLDKERGIIYVPTGSIGDDFYGGFRKGQNLFGNSLVALDAATGKYIWHYQVIHHDLWDRDLPANPNLFNFKKGNKTIPAIAQITKHGYIFVFNRLTGEPLFPIKEVEVPLEALPGEEPWPTQPVPTLPEPFARQHFTQADLMLKGREDSVDLLTKFSNVKFSHMFMPPSKEGSWIFPGFDGGGEWGGASVDPETNIMYISITELPWSLHMADVPKASVSDNRMVRGKNVYERHCMSCHGKDLQGNLPTYPELRNVSKRFNTNELLSIIENGKNMMPGFKTLKASDRQALLAFLSGNEKITTSSLEQEVEAEVPDDTEIPFVPYRMTGYNRFTDKNGVPAFSPPWGTLNAVDLNSGKMLWKVPLGNFSHIDNNGISTGTQIYGGPVSTAGGLVFVAATQDEKIRAFDKKTGKELWSYELPAAGFATPSIYEVDGKQFLVIACGGGKVGNKSGDEWICFSLP